MRVSNTNLLQVQLTEAEKRHIKALAAGQGLTLRQATLQAFQAWDLQLQSRARPAEPARGTRAGAGPPLPGQAKRATGSSEGRRQAEGAPSSSSGGSQVPNPEASWRNWLSRAARLDWSKCPAAEFLPGESGSNWVVRGTRAPLAEVLQSVAAGHPGEKIAEVFEITMQQLTAVLQFATAGVAPAATGS
jgi:uncharacterized protein (DUF433 family)